MPLGVMPGVPPMKGGGVRHWVSCLGSTHEGRGSVPLGVMPGVPPMKGGGVCHWVSCLGFHP